MKNVFVAQTVLVGVEFFSLHVGLTVTLVSYTPGSQCLISSASFTLDGGELWVCPATELLWCEHLPTQID